MDELVKRLRELHPEEFGDAWDFAFACQQAMHEAADAIEELMRFAHFVAREVVVTDEEWELNNLAFPEIICRKLNNLGVVSKDGELWHYEPSIGANLRRGSTKSCGCLRRDKLRERRNAKRQQNNT